MLIAPTRSGLDREQAALVLQRLGTTVAQNWRETLLALGADPREIDRLATGFDLTGERLVSR
jgi:hypothetical protein